MTLPPLIASLKAASRWRPRMPGSASLALRLYFGFSLVLVLLACVVGLGWTQTGNLMSRITVLVDEDQRRSELVSELQGDVKDMVIALANLCLAEDPQDVAFEVKRLSDANEQYRQSGKRLRSLLGLHKIDPSIEADVKAVEEVEHAASQVFDQAANLAKQGATRSAVADFVSAQTAGPQQLWVSALDKLKRNMVAAAQASAQSSRASASAMRAVMAGTGGLALIIGLAAALVITRSIIKPVREAVTFAHRIEKGDLTATLATDRRDEIGVLLGALASMQASLHGMVCEILQCADSIGTASSEVAAGNLDLSHRTELTSSNLQQTSSSLQQLSSLLQQSTESATLATRLASAASEAAARGGTAVSQVIGSMNEISSSSRKMGDIIVVIDGIAFQTNILSLNAAIEAARAGPQGRGFSVVAAEVRSLAHRASLSSREITDLIKSSAECVDSGSELVNKAGSTIQGIVDEVRRVATVISEVTSAAAVQSRGIAEVSGAVDRLDLMTQENAALVEQSAAAAESLREQARRLKQLVAGFQLQAETRALTEAVA